MSFFMLHFLSKYMCMFQTTISFQSSFEIKQLMLYRSSSLFHNELPTFFFVLLLYITLLLSFIRWIFIVSDYFTFFFSSNKKHRFPTFSFWNLSALCSWSGAAEQRPISRGYCNGGSRQFLNWIRNRISPGRRKVPIGIRRNTKNKILYSNYLNPVMSWKRFLSGNA